MTPGWLRPAFGVLLILCGVAQAIAADNREDWFLAGGLTLIGGLNIAWPYLRRAF